MKTTLGKITVIALTALATASCGLSSSAINETCLIYTGGIIEDSEFSKILTPGVNNESIGWGSTNYCYPNDQRSWVAGQDAPEVTVVSNDEVALKVPYQLYFKLNLDPDTIREFHENIGLKTNAWTTEGWIVMLNTYFAPQVDRAMDEAALKFDWRELRSDEDVRADFQREVVISLKRKINEVVGGNYFCGPAYVEGATCGDFTFTVGKPEPTNASLVASIEQEQVNQTKVAAQEAENLRAQAELEIRVQEVELYGQHGYACIRQAEIAAAAGLAVPPCFFGQVTPLVGTGAQ